MRRAGLTTSSRSAERNAPVFAGRGRTSTLLLCWLLAGLLSGCADGMEDPPPLEHEDEEPECVEDEDCNDRDPCTTDTCLSGYCVWERVEAEPVILGTIGTGAPAEDVHLGSYRWLHVAAGRRGIEAYDLGPLPDEPAVLERRRPTAAPAKGVTAIRDHVLALTGSEGIEAFPSGISVAVSRYKTMDPVRSATQVDDLIVASVGARGLEIIDYTDFANPFRLSRVDTPGRAERTLRYGSSLHVSDGLGGVAVIDFRERDAPVLLADRRRATDGRLMALSIRSPLYILAELGAGLGIVDMDQPEIDRLALIQPGGPVSDLSTLSRHTALVAAGDGGLAMIDLLHPAEPRVVWNLTFSGPATRLSRHGELVAVSLGTAGAAVVDLSCTPDEE